VKDERTERKKVLALAQARDIDAILVTELTRWGRSMLDLFHTLQDLQAWNVSLVAQTGLQFDLRIPFAKNHFRNAHWAATVSGSLKKA
jgi:DNA invertase Pin-like site-specific DNA recombinase